MRSKNLFTHNLERKRSFAGNLSRYHAKTFPGLVGSLGTQLDGLFCVAGAERELKAPFR
jgi:hypothetical protein